MSTQSFGRSNNDLKTTRSCAARNGSRCAPNGCNGTIRRPVVELRRPEEQIHRRTSPPEPNLLVLMHSPDVGLGPRDPVGQRPQDTLGVGRVGGDVDVDVGSGPGFERVIGERQRAAERVSDFGRSERPVDLDHLVDEGRLSVVHRVHETSAHRGLGAAPPAARRRVRATRRGRIHAPRPSAASAVRRWDAASDHPCSDRNRLARTRPASRRPHALR